ncbi:hypothetical protein [Streptosporangium sp. NPDC000239]|uniref:hypothetical protein n=1 Tax=unclassified Streptosporangium TaxID=2632669 RepID=UPI00332C45C7
MAERKPYPSDLTDAQWALIGPVLTASAHENTAGVALLDRVTVVTEGSVTKVLVDQGFKNTVVAHGAGLGSAVDIVKRNPADKALRAPVCSAVIRETDIKALLNAS